MNRYEYVCVFLHARRHSDTDVPERKPTQEVQTCNELFGSVPITCDTLATAVLFITSVNLQRFFFNAFHFLVSTYINYRYIVI